MPPRSAGVLLYRRPGGELEVLVAHPGGPFWARKDDGAWSIPKGLVDDGEDPLVAARREFEEETGAVAPAGPWLDLGEIRLKSGKVVRAFAAEGDLDPAGLRSNTFEMNGRTFPEIDRVEWLAPGPAKRKLNPAQGPLVDRLVAELTAE